MIDLNDELRGVLDALGGAGIEFRLTGSLADQMNTRFARVRVDLSEIQRERPTRRRPRR